VAKNGEQVNWRSAFNAPRVMDKLEAISASDKAPEEKAHQISVALKSLTSPAKITFPVQLGGVLEVEEAIPEVVVGDTTQPETIHQTPAKKVGKFPKKTKEISNNE